MSNTQDRFGCRIGGVPAKINQALSTEPKTAEEIAKEVGVPVSKVKTHFRYWIKRGKPIVESDMGFALASDKGITVKTAALTRTTDEKARLSLPQSFANATVLIEQVSDTELRIRKARVIPEDEILFREELTTKLSDRDRDLFLSLLENPPAPSEGLKKLVARFGQSNE